MKTNETDRERLLLSWPKRVALAVGGAAIIGGLGYEATIVLESAHAMTPAVEAQCKPELDSYSKAVAVPPPDCLPLKDAFRTDGSKYILPAAQDLSQVVEAYKQDNYTTDMVLRIVVASVAGGLTATTVMFGTYTPRPPESFEVAKTESLAA